MPLAFLPLNGVPNTKLGTISSRNDLDASAEHHEPLFRRGLMCADRPVQLHSGHVEIPMGNLRVQESRRAKLLDRS